MVRRWVAELLRGRVDEEIVQDVQLIANELVSNAYDHGRWAVRVRVSLPTAGAPRVRVEVDDTSSDLPVLGRSRLTDLRGRGLVLVNALSTRWGARPKFGGKTVWADVATTATP